MIDAVINYLKEHNLHTVKVLTESVVNYRFYEKCGFQLVEEYNMGIKNLDNYGKVYLLNF